MRAYFKHWAKPLALIGAVGALVGLGHVADSAEGDKVPTFTYDGAWPKLPLPNNWTFEGITGLVVDKDDTIWVLNRPGDYDNDPIFRRPEGRSVWGRRKSPSGFAFRNVSGTSSSAQQWCSAPRRG